MGRAAGRWRRCGVALRPAPCARRSPNTAARPAARPSERRGRVGARGGEAECGAGRGQEAGWGWGCGRVRATLGADAAPGSVVSVAPSPASGNTKVRPGVPASARGRRPVQGSPVSRRRLGDAEPPRRARSCRVPCGEPLPVQGSPGCKQKPFFSAFWRALLFSSLKIVFCFREKSPPAFLRLRLRLPTQLLAGGSAEPAMAKANGHFLLNKVWLTRKFSSK